MQRIDTDSRAVDLHGTGKDGFRDPGAPGVDGTELSAAFANGVQEEILAVVEASGQTPDADDLHQMLGALRKWFSGLRYRNHERISIADMGDGYAALAIPGYPHRWVAGGDSGDYAHSDNGYDWTGIEDSAAETIYGFAYYSSTLIAVGANAMFVRTTNTSTPSWSTSTPAGSYTGDLKSVAVGTTHVVAVGTNGGIQRAAVGALGTLTRPTPDASYAGDFVAVLYDAENERFIAFGDDGEVQVSDDEGETWEQTLAAGTAAWMSAATDGEGNLLALSSDGDLQYSDDCGATWQQCALNVTSGGPGAVAFDGINWLVTYQDDASSMSLIWTTDITLTVRETIRVGGSPFHNPRALAVRGGDVICAGGSMEVVRFTQLGSTV